MTDKEKYRAVIGKKWRHKKTGHVYVVLGMCRLEATNRLAFLYALTERDVKWARDADEFLDGRFEQMKGNDDG